MLTSSTYVPTQDVLGPAVYDSYPVVHRRIALLHDAFESVRAVTLSEKSRD